MLKDCECCGRDAAALLDHRVQCPFVDPSWHLSDAKPLLEEDVTAGAHNKCLPSMLWGTRPECMAFSPEIFQKRLGQETKKQRKIESNLKFDRKKFRMPADSDDKEAPAHAVIKAIEKCDQSSPKKPKAKVADPAREARKKQKVADIAGLSEGHKAKVSRKK